MPRVENLGRNVDEWCEREGDGSSTYDLCNHCAQDIDIDPHLYDMELIPYGAGEPQGLDGWGGNVEHPSYADMPDSPYECEVCGEELTAEDD